MDSCLRRNGRGQPGTDHPCVGRGIPRSPQPDAPFILNCVVSPSCPCRRASRGGALFLAAALDSCLRRNGRGQPGTDHPCVGRGIPSGPQPDAPFILNRVVSPSCPCRRASRGGVLSLAVALDSCLRRNGRGGPGNNHPCVGMGIPRSPQPDAPFILNRVVSSSCPCRRASRGGALSLTVALDSCLRRNGRGGPGTDHPCVGRPLNNSSFVPKGNATAVILNEALRLRSG